MTTPVKDPEIIIFNHDLSKDIGLDFSEINGQEIALIFRETNYQMARTQYLKPMQVISLVILQC